MFYESLLFVEWFVTYKGDHLIFLKKLFIEHSCNALLWLIF